VLDSTIKQRNPSLSYLPEDYEQLAREHKMLEVQYGNAKISWPMYSS